MRFGEISCQMLDIYLISFHFTLFVLYYYNSTFSDEIQVFLQFKYLPYEDVRNFHSSIASAKSICAHRCPSVFLFIGEKCTDHSVYFFLADARKSAGCRERLRALCGMPRNESRLSEKCRFLAIPFTYSGFPMVKLARDLVAKGELGAICKVVLEYQQGSFRKIDFTKPLDKRNAWKMNPARSGRSCVVADIGVHAFHLVEYVTGLEADRILADLSSYAPGNALDDDASVLMRLRPATSAGSVPAVVPKASIVISKIATGEENGVRLRVYGDKASLFWNQEAPNYLSVKYPFGPEKTYKRKAPYIAEESEACNRASRIPAGHHEGFIEAFANIYDEFCASVQDRQPHDFPGPREGVRTMRFVEAALKSNAAGNVWEQV